MERELDDFEPALRSALRALREQLDKATTAAMAVQELCERPRADVDEERKGLGLAISRASEIELRRTGQAAGAFVQVLEELAKDLEAAIPEGAG